jgi:hypothetical protein
MKSKKQKSQKNKLQILSKKSIFAIALVFSLGTAFSQETETVTLPTAQHAINTKGTGGNESIVSDVKLDAVEGESEKLHLKLDGVKGESTHNKKSENSNSNSQEPIVETKEKKAKKSKEIAVQSWSW